MEGPQTRALADHLNEALTGRPIARIQVPEGRWQANVLLLNCVGQVLQRVRSHGKWLFFDFSHGVTWMCQLITRSRWTLRGESEPTSPPAMRASSGRRSEPLLTVIFRGDHAGAGGFAPRCTSDRQGVTASLTGHPVFYIVPTERVRQHPEIAALGPDPLTSATFYEDFSYRLRKHPSRTLAAALLDQEVLAGLGNPLKCEVLFAMRFSPGVRIGALLATQIDHLAGTVVGLTATATTFAVNNEPYPYRVYDRAGLPCGICDSEIVVDRSGKDAHLTWHCPGCQPAVGEPTLFERE